LIDDYDGRGGGGVVVVEQSAAEQSRAKGGEVTWGDALEIGLGPIGIADRMAGDVERK
jgi:hypothetical protein